MIPSTNDSVQWFKSYWPSKFSRDLCDHHLTTVQRENNCLVRNCHSLLLHVRVLPPKFCSFRRSGRVLARSIKIVGARLSNQPTCMCITTPMYGRVPRLSQSKKALFIGHTVYFWSATPCKSLMKWETVPTITCTYLARDDGPRFQVDMLFSLSK